MLTLQVAMCLDVPLLVKGRVQLHDLLNLPRPLIRASKLSVMFSYSAMQLHS
jgi:hypothetical protein